MAFIVVYDACVLFPAPLRDLLLRVALTGAVRARWSHPILDECFLNILAQRRDLSKEKLDATRSRMIASVPDCIVTGFEDLIEGLQLPDPGDRHVLAAAIRAGAQTIVTANLKDFPHENLKPYGIEAQKPDDFVVDLLDIAPDKIVSAVRDQQAALKAPPKTMPEVLETLRNQGLSQTVTRLEELLKGAI